MAKTYQLRRESTQQFRIDYRDLLNDQQYEAVMAPDGPTLIIAGAGSGKTRTLTYRVARLIESGTSPHRLMLVTFTNRAARDMLSRIEALLGEQARAVFSGTFHSLGLRLIREHAAKLDYPRNFTVLDSGDAADLMKQCIADVDPKKRRSSRFPRSKTLVRLKSRSVNTRQTVDDIIQERYSKFEHYTSDIIDCLHRYQSRKQQVGAMDFDDLLVNWQRLMTEHDDVRERIQKRFDHVLVDEYQDTNALQAELVETVASNSNITVVGDDCQAIYAFRGANYQNILEFPDRFEDAKTFYLEENYRSSPQIVRLANRSIRHNKDQFQKNLVSNQPDAPLPGIFRCRNTDYQASFVAQRILELRDEGVGLDQMAVLYRAHYHAMELQLELDRRNIPYVVRSGLRFFEQRHIKDVLAFLRFIDNPRDELAFRRLAMICDGVGDVTADSLFAFTQQDLPLETILASPDFISQASKRAQHDWKQAVHLLRQLKSDALMSNVAESIDLIRKSFYEDKLESNFDNADSRLREIESLAEFAATFGSRREFLDNLSLESGISGQEKLPNQEEADEYVILSTIHQAKGLEFHTVFVLSTVEERIPFVKAMRDADELQEERRLFYVATTRAKRELNFCVPTSAFVRGEGQVALRESRFLTEVDQDEDDPIFERWRISG
jgi:DNA helicase-2/ATP-dependent DNA helicase PcrA